MSTYRLKNLLAPRSLALVGASPRQGSVGGSILRNIRNAKFKGEFGLVNSQYAEIDGVATVGSLNQLPFVPELVVITTPPATVAGLIEEAGKLGAAGAVIIPAGLGHGEGSLAEAAERAARKYGMRLIGPNCLGILMPGADLNASFSAHMPVAGNLALISQSGAIATGMVDWAAQRAVGFLRNHFHRRPARRRYRRSPGLLRAGWQDARDPALCRSDQGCPQVHVRGPRRRQDQAGRRRQIRPHGAGGEGGGDPYRRAGGLGRGVRRRVSSRRNPAGVRPSRIVRLRRDAGARRVASGKAARDPDQWRRHRCSRDRPALRIGRNSGSRSRPRPAKSSTRSCRRHGPDQIPSISLAMPIRRAMRRRSRSCWPMRPTMRSWS